MASLMRVLEKVVLHRVQSGKRQLYEIQLCEGDPGAFVVNYRLQLSDGSFYDGSLTGRPVERAHAERILARAVENRESEGYVVQGKLGLAPTPAAAAPAAPAAAPAKAAPVASTTTALAGSAATAAASAGLRRFEFVQGSSAKFWAASVEGNDFIVVYGRIGSAGTRNVKSFGSAADADREMRKKIAEKTREGYVEITTGSAAPAPKKKREKGDDSAIRRALLQGLEVYVDRKRMLLRMEEAREVARLVERVSARRMTEAEPTLLKLVPGSGAALQVVLCRALGRCGTMASVSTLGALYADHKGPEPVRRAALESLLMLSDEVSAEGLRVTLRKTLPESLQAHLPGGDPDALRMALAEHLAGNTAEQHSVVSMLGIINDPASRPAVLDYARTMALAPPSFRQLRHLFRTAEHRRDAELFGILVHRIETTRSESSTSYANLTADAGTKGTGAYSTSTRTYLRRRIWRTLRSLGSLADEAFVPMAVGVLLTFTDADAEPPRTSVGTWDAKTRRSIHGWYGPYAAYYTFNKLLYRHSARFVQAGRLFFHTPPGVELSAPRKAGEEAFAELWQREPRGLLHLLIESRCGEVHAFAAPALAANTAFTAQLDLDTLKLLLGRRYEATAAMAFDLAWHRYDPKRPDVDLLAALVTCAYEPARRQAATWIQALGDRVREQTTLLSALLLSPHADGRQLLRTLLGGIKLPAAAATALVARAVAGLLALGPADETTAKGAAGLLGEWFAPQLLALPAPVVRDLLGHPVGAVQAVGAEAVFASGKAPPDDIFGMLLTSAHDEVRAVVMAWMRRLPDAELVGRPRVVARMLTHASLDMRQTGRDIGKRLTAASALFGPELTSELVSALIRNLLPKEAGPFVLEVLLHDLPATLATLDGSLVMRLLQSRSPVAQELGGSLLIGRPELGASYTVDELSQLCHHEVLAVRQAAFTLLKGDLTRLRGDVMGAIRALDTPWDDARSWMAALFREQLTAADLPIEVLVAITDSVRPDIEALGRELLRRHFRDEDGPELVLRLSEHPAPGAQLMVTEMLDPFAGGQPAQIRGLMPYFAAVLGRVNRGRTSKKRVLAFLRVQAELHEEIAAEVLPLLYRLTASVSVEYRAQALEAIAAIGRAHPTLDRPVPLLAPEVRHGVHVRLPGRLEGRQPGRPDAHELCARPQPPAHVLLG